MRCFSILSIALLLSACASEEVEGLRVCEADLLDELKAPSTFKLVAAYRGEMPPIDREAWISRMEREIAQEEAHFSELSTADRGVLAYSKEVVQGKHPEVLDDLPTANSYAILLSYDAENSFGAPLRGHYWCRMTDKVDEPDGVFEADTVDGKELEEVKTLMEEVRL